MTGIRHAEGQVGSWYSYLMEHSIRAAQLDHLKEWLKAILNAGLVKAALLFL